MTASIRLVSADELAAELGYKGPNDAFRGFCRNIGIMPVRRNPNFYDPKMVRVRLDQAQGMVSTDPKPESSSLVEQRRARLGTA